MEVLPGLVNASGWAVAVTVLLTVIRAWLKDDLVSGAHYRRAIKRGDFWRDRALAGTSLARAATDVAEERADAE